MWGGKRLSNKTCTYLLLDCQANLLATAELDSPFDAPKMQMRVTQGQTSDVQKAGVVQAVSTDDSEVTQMVKVLIRRGSILIMEPLRNENIAVRKQVRILIHFDSCVHWEGKRIEIKSTDLSCGGIAFESIGVFNPGMTMEVELPITNGEPMVLPCEIVRVMPHSGKVRMYGSRFTQITEEQEATLRDLINREIQKRQLNPGMNY